MKKNYYKTIILAAIVGLSYFNVWADGEIPISSVTDLQKIGIDVAYPLSGSYYLTADIDLAGVADWLPIGATSTTTPGNAQFSGVFDGKGYSIKNLKIITSNVNFKGLFVRLFNAEVKDLDLVNVDIKGNTSVGGVSGAMLSETMIERVSVTGNIEGYTEVGGIVGRVARNNANTGYNKIHDCYVSANIKATSLSTEMGTAPSCAGGIVAYTHSTNGNAVAKIEVARSYFTGRVESEQMTNRAGNAAGILAFYDNHEFVRMSECLVLADEIIAATPNYFFCRRGVVAANLELLEKLYVREGITLTYFDNLDPGFGASMPAGSVIDTLPLNTFKTAVFYTDNENLSWDFEDVWTITEGSLPVLKRNTSGEGTNISTPNSKNLYSLSTIQGALVINPLSEISVNIFNVTGAQVHSIQNLNTKTTIMLPKGVYIVQSLFNGLNYAEKVIVK